ncbi:MAG: hypothetical protein ACYC6N_06750 [Pirellulaceae bacterium]
MRGALLTVLATIALVTVPVVVVEWPREISRWYVASATELALSGEYAAAVARLDQALRWDDSQPQLYLTRARYKLEAGQWQSGLEDCDRVRRLVPDDAAVGELRSQLLQHLGRHREAVAEWREILQAGSGEVPFRRAHQLNGMAYAMAIGTLDLEQGLAAANEALRIVANVPAILDPAGVLSFGRAVTAQQIGDNQLALSQAGEACDYAEAVLKRTAERKASGEGKVVHAPLPFTDELQALRAHLAGILDLRARLYDELEKPEEAAKDRARKKELASDGNLIEARPYDLSTAIERVSSCASFLDTRGFVLYKLGALDAAYHDLQLALEACERIWAVLPSQVEAMKYYISDIRPLLANERQHRRTLAVVCYHHMLVLEAQGKQQEAEQARKRIRDLGYEPGQQLF